MRKVALGSHTCTEKIAVEVKRSLLHYLQFFNLLAELFYLLELVGLDKVDELHALHLVLLLRVSRTRLLSLLNFWVLFLLGESCSQQMEYHCAVFASIETKSDLLRLEHCESTMERL